MFQKVKRKTKRNERQKQKDRTWKVFSQYIRTRDCIATTGDPEYGKCCTCGKIKPFAELDAGHYISGRSNSVLFNEMGVNAQCRHCNRFQEGNKGEYELFMLERYGKEKCDKLKMAKHIKTTLGFFELKALEQDYKEKLKVLKGVIQ